MYYAGFKACLSRRWGRSLGFKIAYYNLNFQALHKIMPHFAERDEKTNAFRQQDAHECWSTVISNLAQTLKMDTPQSSEVCTN